MQEITSNNVFGDFLILYLSTCGADIEKIDELDEYQSKINDIAEQNCKSKAEWKAEEINYTKADYTTKHKSAGELQDRYQRKLYLRQRKEMEIRDKIKACEKRIDSLKKDIKILETYHYPRKLKKKLNQLQYQKEYLVLLENYLCNSEHRRRKYEYLNMKWTGIMQKIIVAEITKEIDSEKQGESAPYYGFGDNRETSPYIHKDN